MPDISKQITLTTKGANAGPLFDVYYSTDCINYTICVDGSGVSLPNVGSTVIVTVPDTTICIKLTNLSPECGENYQISGSLPTTTTTSTSTSTSTTTSTTSTTTEPPITTSTTTGAPIIYDLYTADKYDCTTEVPVDTVTVALPTGTIPNYTKFYNSDTDLGIYAYQLISSTEAGPGIILNTTQYDTLLLACPIT